jgi:ubiquinone/menaquinone biosynthesis C-methylase UbiE
MKKFTQHPNIIWGPKCQCGKKVSILQTDHHPWVKTDFTPVVTCSNCNRQLKIDQQAAAKFYNQLIAEQFQGLSGQILDLGCGSGFLSYIALQNPQVEFVTGLDSDANSAEPFSQLDENSKFIHADVSQLDQFFSEDSVDWIICRDFLMFVKDTGRFFDAITKISKTGLKMMNWYRPSDARVQNKLAPSQIKDELEKRGWKIELKPLEWYSAGYLITALKA